MRGVELVGPSGVGKTAIKRALLRHYSFNDAADENAADTDAPSPVDIPALRRIIERYPSELNHARWRAYANRRVALRERLDKNSSFVLDECVMQLILAMMSRRRHPWMGFLSALSIIHRIEMPDLLVFVTCDPAVAMQRQEQRGRIVSYEANYYQRTSAAQALIRLACLLYRQPALHIDTSHLDTGRSAAVIANAWSKQAS